ncbi:MAG: hypothetical protein ACTHLA_11885 [Asticcacaulis sp.]|uniref:hypothetical protein n=1 Tax=Asticcacaulis sp. TaxID=1872648 RepID=UPI003F7BFAA4
MSDDAIINALAKRAELEVRIAKAEEVIKRSKAQILEVNRFIKQWEKYSSRSVDDFLSSKTLSNKVDSTTRTSQDNAKNPKKEEIAEAVVEILEKTGKAMSRSDLFKALQERGIVLYGANPEMLLSTMLWRTKEAFGINRLKGGGYALPDMIASEDEVDLDTDLSDLIG